MKKSDFYFDLPEELIAQNPISPRDRSRLMVLDRTEKTIRHHHFFELPSLLPENSVLVINTTKVIAARLYVVIDNKEGELLLLKKKKPHVWKCMVKPGKKFTRNTSFRVKGRQTSITGCVEKIHPDGTRDINFDMKGNFSQWLSENGYAPYPPYIKDTSASFEDYQTTYAKDEGSVAAPTAGLHFTDRVFEALKKRNIDIIPITLHVGRGTFLPVKSEYIQDHVMHKEWYELSQESAALLNKAKRENRSIIAVGTTSVRTLESNINKSTFTAKTEETDIFIYPGYTYKAVDGIITNFHLPESTLIMLISAFAGRDFILNAYRDAVNKKYRFYSFGDAMLIY
ncbi:tRNA preQ1(34) S-adenosylmethionine ribosyltransferase-isomerase QueA [Candidatus Peregrinibacteria bacterium]|nr:tRNA preQ1(34) S-adenosylmethionine ribosyltransferase-isomerase QueA [Candidatus Peregrinibacteria bacterium]